MNVKDYINNCKIQIENLNTIKNYLSSLNELQDISSIQNPTIFFNIISSCGNSQQFYLLRDYISNKCDLQIIDGNKDNGTFRNNNGDTFTLKTSSNNKSNSLNIRQIRPWQNVSKYICVYVNKENIPKSKVYILSKNNMCEEIENYGDYCHGTTLANSKNKNIEFSISLPLNNHKIIDKWDRKYLNYDLTNKIFGNTNG